ncbi:hypothetical protein JKP88DRAFT_264083 [Tribonema minus]|uniref:Kinesin motor domain-containing protein n=1 Tax=Tribonema minus TaxID=303371 RepID=A0A835YZG5_9STRA|nr:hypothetical protein JKP88DRAFT_264083 [Tribonema minus]
MPSSSGKSKRKSSSGSSRKGTGLKLVEHGPVKPPSRKSGKCRQDGQRDGGFAGFNPAAIGRNRSASDAGSTAAAHRGAGLRAAGMGGGDKGSGAGGARGNATGARAGSSGACGSAIGVGSGAGGARAARAAVPTAQGEAGIGGADGAGSGATGAGGGVSGASGGASGAGIGAGSAAGGARCGTSCTRSGAGGASTGAVLRDAEQRAGDAGGNGDRSGGGSAERGAGGEVSDTEVDTDEEVDALHDFRQYCEEVCLTHTAALKAAVDDKARLLAALHVLDTQYAKSMPGAPDAGTHRGAFLHSGHSKESGRLQDLIVVQSETIIAEDARVRALGERLPRMAKMQYSKHRGGDSGNNAVQEWLDRGHAVAALEQLLEHGLKVAYSGLGGRRASAAGSSAASGGGSASTSTGGAGEGSAQGLPCDGGGGGGATNDGLPHAWLPGESALSDGGSDSGHVPGTRLQRKGRRAHKHEHDVRHSCDAKRRSAMSVVKRNAAIRGIALQLDINNGPCADSFAMLEERCIQDGLVLAGDNKLVILVEHIVQNMKNRPDDRQQICGVRFPDSNGITTFFEMCADYEWCKAALIHHFDSPQQRERAWHGLLLLVRAPGQHPLKYRNMVLAAVRAAAKTTDSQSYEALTRGMPKQVLAVLEEQKIKSRLTRGDTSLDHAITVAADTYNAQLAKAQRDYPVAALSGHLSAAQAKDVLDVVTMENCMAKAYLASLPGHRLGGDLGRHDGRRADRQGEGRRDRRGPRLRAFGARDGVPKRAPFMCWACKRLVENADTGDHHGTQECLDWSRRYKQYTHYDACRDTCLEVGRLQLKLDRLGGDASKLKDDPSSMLSRPMHECTPRGPPSGSFTPREGCDRSNNGRGGGRERGRGDSQERRRDEDRDRGRTRDDHQRARGDGDRRGGNDQRRRGESLPPSARVAAVVAGDAQQRSTSGGARGGQRGRGMQACAAAQQRADGAADVGAQQRSASAAPATARVQQRSDDGVRAQQRSDGARVQQRSDGNGARMQQRSDDGVRAQQRSNGARVQQRSESNVRVQHGVQQCSNGDDMRAQQRSDGNTCLQQRSGSAGTQSRADEAGAQQRASRVVVAVPERCHSTIAERIHRITPNLAPRPSLSRLAASSLSVPLDTAGEDMTENGPARVLRHASLFSGIGGWEAGFEQLHLDGVQVDTVLAVNNDPIVTAAYSNTFAGKGKRVLTASVGDAKVTEAVAGAAPDVVTYSAPCTDYATTLFRGRGASTSHRAARLTEDVVLQPFEEQLLEVGLHPKLAGVSEYDGILEPGSSAVMQSLVYDEVSHPAVHSLMKEQWPAGSNNKTIVAKMLVVYGTTNAGKTFTVLGSAADPGILPHALMDIFELAPSAATITLRCTEVYKNKVRDLLDIETATADKKERRQTHNNGINEVRIAVANKSLHAFVTSSRSHLLIDISATLNGQTDNMHFWKCMRIAEKRFKAAAAGARPYDLVIVGAASPASAAYGETEQVLQHTSEAFKAPRAIYDMDSSFLNIGPGWDDASNSAAAEADRRHVEDLQQRDAQHQFEMEKLKTRMEGVEAENVTLKEELEKVRCQQAELLSNQTGEQEAREAAVEPRNELARLEPEEQVLKAVQLRVHAGEADNQIAELREDNATLHARIDEVKQQMETMQHTLVEVFNKQTKEKEVQEHMRTLHAAESENSLLVKRLQAAESEKSTLTEELERLRFQQKELLSNRIKEKEMCMAYRMFSKFADQCSCVAITVIMQVVEFRQDNEALRQQVEQLKQQVQEQNDKLQAGAVKYAALKAQNYASNLERVLQYITAKRDTGFALNKNAAKRVCGNVFEG